ncbi:reverse transcriptase domain-containing protein [Tanacetum coccineum]
MPNNVKTYDGTGDPEDQVKIFQAAAQVERWAMPTWCHMFNSTLIGTTRVWFDKLPLESIDGYKDLKTAFLAYFMQQKKYVKDPVEIHNIKQTDGETIEDFMERFKVKTGRMNGAPECMQIFEFMHGVNNPELTKRLNEHVPKTMEEMMTHTRRNCCCFQKESTGGTAGNAMWGHMFYSTPKGPCESNGSTSSSRKHRRIQGSQSSLLSIFYASKEVRQRSNGQKKYVKDPVEIHNIKQRDGETIEDFMERFKRLNEHVPKTMEEMMTATTAFIRGETAAASKKKGHTS